MTSTTVQIISIIAPVGAVVLGFALGVWWNNHQQKKRDEREIEAFEMNVQVYIENSIVDLFRLQSSFMQYDRAVPLFCNSEIETIGFSKYTFQNKIDIPISFSVQNLDQAKNILLFFIQRMGQIDHFAYEEYGILKDVQNKIRNGSITKEQAERQYVDELNYIRRYMPEIENAIRQGIILLCEITGENQDEKYEQIKEQFNVAKQEEVH